MFSISQPCSRCGGRGTVIDDPCPTCDGRGVTAQTKRYRVKIPAGVRDGSRIRLAGKGEPGFGGGPPGDLYVVTRVAPSPVFKRKGNNLEVEVPISIAEAVRGGNVEVPTLSGTKQIRIPAGTRDGTVQRLRGEGPPKLSGSGSGDIHYRLRIDVPNSLNEEQREAVERLAEVMNGDPRANLLARARARS
jgi:molecular chaperone DnaJ